ncbi:MAG TPA: sigma 54-interacting transcriptional regulator [Nitrospira sp.]|nr:sigma 54-interacting transcriptional regulator [Nitrospira sp.]
MTPDVVPRDDQHPSLHARRKADEFLRALVKGTISSTGGEFLRELVKQVSSALGIRYAFVGYLLQESRIRTLAFWKGDSYMDQLEYGLDGTPCTKVIQGETCLYTQDVQALFPRDRELAMLGVTSYLAVPLKDPRGKVLGHLVAMDVKPMVLTDEEIEVFKLFGERAGVEIYRQSIEAALRDREATLHAIAEGTAAEVGAGFFRSLVKNLASALGVTYSFVSEFCVDRTKVRTLAFWGGDHFKENFEYAIAHTPCEKVLAGELYHCAEQVAERFPLHKEELEGLGVESYLAIPMTSASGDVLGHLAVMDTKRMDLEQLDLSVFKIFGARAGAELERTHMEDQLKENEGQLRDLFDEAPIAYVNEGLDTRFIRANKTAMKSLGITPDEVEGTYGRTFIPDTPEAQRRLKEALASIGKGIDTGGVVLELRRKDNGKPLWIQWWSKPDPSGIYTRTMFIDITERVLMEQEKARLEAANVYLQEEIKTEHNFEEIIGASPAIKKVLQAIEKVAGTDATVLVTGETGTGKELIARALHNLSQRKDGVLVKVNCAAIPAGLVESELFGHEKGAFTGALARKIGRFELADRATIFLDEVGEIPLELQTKLLRVLQEGEFERLGSTRTLKVNVRVIAATNRDLEKEVREGRFRSDLYYRLKVFPIVLPALRDRKQDLPLLVSYFVKKYSSAMGKKVESVPGATMELLKNYTWPGNIRELEHVIERAVILNQGPELELGDWMPRSTEIARNGGFATLEEIERAHILAVLNQTNWRVSGDKGAAKILGLNPTTLEARMKKLGIQRPS